MKPTVQGIAGNLTVLGGGTQITRFNSIDWVKSIEGEGLNSKLVEQSIKIQNSGLQDVAYLAITIIVEPQTGTINGGMAFFRDLEL